MMWMLPFLLVVTIVFVLVMIGVFTNKVRYAPGRSVRQRWRDFLCDALGWHGATSLALPGESLQAHCPHCRREVHCDMNGEWFSFESRP